MARRTSGTPASVQVAHKAVGNMSTKANTNRRSYLLLSLLGIGTGWLLAFTFRVQPSKSVVAADKLGSSTAPPAHGVEAPEGLKPSPPTFKPNEVQMDATAPGYKPTDLVGVVSMEKIFEREPRATTWAMAVESYLFTKMAKEIGEAIPGVRVNSVQCKTATCKIDLDFPDSVLNLRVQQTLAAMYSPGAGASIGNGDFILAYRGRTSWLRDVPDNDASALFSAIEKRRKEHLASIKRDAKAGLKTPYKYVNVADLPDE